MKPLVIKQSVLKMMAAFLVSIAFTAGGFFLFNNTDFVYYIVTACFSIFSIFAIINIFRPYSLTLDDCGFTVTGGIIAKPRRELWEDVSEFFLEDIDIPIYLQNTYSFLGIRAGKRIAYNYTQTSMHESSGAKTARLISGSDAGVSGAWNCSQSELLRLLNEYRSAALASSSN